MDRNFLGTIKYYQIINFFIDLVVVNELGSA